MMYEAILCDPCFWTYIAIVIVAIYGFGLFIWWWHKIGHASEVYIYFTLLLFSEAFYNSFNAMARYFRLNDKDISDYIALVDHPAWEFRAVIHFLILFMIVGRMTMRAISTMRKVKRFKLEENHVQDTDS